MRQFLCVLFSNEKLNAVKGFLDHVYESVTVDPIYEKWVALVSFISSFYLPFFNNNIQFKYNFQCNIYLQYIIFNFGPVVNCFQNIPFLKNGAMKMYDV